jgi:hypothetical protein
LLDQALKESLSWTRYQFDEAFFVAMARRTSANPGQVTFVAFA